jgi:cell division protein FtsB
MSTLFSQARTRIPRFADAAVERARLTVVPSRRVDAPKAPFVVLVVLLLAGGVAGLLAFNTSMQQAAFTVTDLQHRADALTARRQSLSMDIEKLRDPQQLATRAKKLGMVPPMNPAFLRLSDDKVLGQPVAATPLDSLRINPLPAVKPKVLAPKPRIVKVVVPRAPQKKSAKHGAGSTDPQGTGGRKNQATGNQGTNR